MASHLSLIKEGLKERNWNKVSDGYEQISGERIEVQNEKSPNVDREVKKHLAKYFIKLGTKLADELSGTESLAGEILAEVEEDVPLVQNKASPPISLFEDDDADVIKTDVKLDSRNQPKFSNIVVNAQMVDDDSVPPDNQAIYTNAIKNPTPSRDPRRMVEIECRSCHCKFEREAQLVLILDDGVNGDICEDCLRKRRTNG